MLFAALFAVCYALHGERISPDPASPVRFQLLTGDEPHYLLVAHSLAFDGRLTAYLLSRTRWRSTVTSTWPTTCASRTSAPSPNGR